MALQYFRIGTNGPYEYDDTEYIQEEAADTEDPTYNPQNLETVDGFHCTGQIFIDSAPTKDHHIVRYADAEDALTEHIHPFLLIGA